MKLTKEGYGQLRVLTYQLAKKGLTISQIVKEARDKGLAATGYYVRKIAAEHGIEITSGPNGRPPITAPPISVKDLEDMIEDDDLESVTEVEDEDDEDESVRRLNDGGKPHVLPETAMQILQCIRLRKEGTSYTAIAETVGVPLQSVKNWLRRYSLDRGEVTNFNNNTEDVTSADERVQRLERNIRIMKAYARGLSLTDIANLTGIKYVTVRKVVVSMHRPNHQGRY